MNPHPFFRRQPRQITPVGSFVVLLLLAAAECAFYRQGFEALLPLPEETAAPDGWYTLAFSDPTGPAAQSLRGGPDALLAEAIQAARFSVDVAIYDFNLWSVRDALLRAMDRGVRVRVVMESDNILEPEVQELEAAGIEVVGDRREPLMHHKFVVIDRLDIWTGSMNFTVSGAYRNDNNLLRVRSSRLAENYTREFEEMFLEDRFGALSMSDTPFPSVSIDGRRVEVLFSPDDGVRSRLLELLRGAQASIDFMVFTFTSDEIADAILERATSGIAVRGVLESSRASTQGGEFERLKEAGLNVRLDGNSANMHHKVILIDGVRVVTGSYNLSRNAEEKNDENLVIIEDRELTLKFEQEFERIFRIATP